MSIGKEYTNEEKLLSDTCGSWEFAYGRIIRLGKIIFPDTNNTGFKNNHFARE